MIYGSRVQDNAETDMTKPGEAPRRAALALLETVTEERRLLSDLFPEAVASLPPEDRARAQRLAEETLRWMDRADRMLGPFVKARPDARIMHALRLGTVEMADGAAPHGVIDTLVGAIRKDRTTAHAAGMVNAVLRRVSERLADWSGLPVPRLPKWLRKPLLATYGRTAVEAMEAAHSRGAPLDLTPRDGNAETLAASLGGMALPTASVRLESPGKISDLPGYEEGSWWVQDAAAALPARCGGNLAGRRVLDMCAAPGGKTLQMASAGADVTALDISASRLARLRENLARTGLRARVVEADAAEWRPETPCDAVLLDAPCTATGTIRRHPDLPYVKDGRGIADLTALQERLIDNAASFLSPGGLLIFCTCSLLPEEGEAQIEAALQRHAGLAYDGQSCALPGLPRGALTPHGLRLRPDHWAEWGGIDGFFISALRKTA